MGPFKCDSQTDELDYSVEEEEVLEEELEDEEDDEDVDEFGLKPKERSKFCAAFTLLDADGDGIITPREIESIIVTLGRETTKDNLDEIMAFCTVNEIDGKFGMDFKGFYQYFAKQLVNTDDELGLRNAFETFESLHHADNPVPPGCTDMAVLRHYLKHFGMILTDDEIDYLWEEEYYWMLDEKLIETEYLIKKLLEDSEK